MFQITNGILDVEISDNAAEVHSLKKVNDDYNYVWCGDPAYWSGRNPILFPQVGHTKENTIKINGIKKPIGNHGFARRRTFELVDQKEDELTLRIKENEETLDYYPYKFELKVNYKLNNKRLDITYTITNNDEKIMPYGFGLHPAFACQHDYKNTKIVFNAKEDIGEEVIVNQELFDNNPTLVIDSPKSTLATLISEDKSISIEYIGYKIFAIWSKGDYVCLEPWLFSSEEDSDKEFETQKDIIFLKPNESNVHKYSWIVND